MNGSTIISSAGGGGGVVPVAEHKLSLDRDSPSPLLSPAFGKADRIALFSRHRESSPIEMSQSNGLGVKGHSRVRARSISESGQEVVRQLAFPVSIPLVVLCLGWYATSAFSNALNKTILDSFPYPITLSMVQFLLAVSFGVTTILSAQHSPYFYSILPKGVTANQGIRYPTGEILLMTMPMGCFQLSGHIFSHMSTRLLPVSLVHTIKALSPLFTVAAYRILFNVSYNRKTYLTLIPLTIGVIMTCSAELDAHFMGVLYALMSTLIFVSQNMFSKNLLTADQQQQQQEPGTTTNAKKLDKLNLLCYCSSIAFIFTSPLWLVSEGFTIFGDMIYQRVFFDPDNFEATSGVRLLTYFFMNGLVHFLQNILAFQVLGMVSPVTYSVASLIKRIVVITVAIIWFGQQVTSAQGWGILLTFTGLYLYDRFGGDRKKKYEPTNPVLPK